MITKHTGGKSNHKRHCCEKCESSFIRASEKKRHMLIHSGERPNRCEGCGYTCGRINQLKTHKLIHSDTKPFQCKKCNYSSTQASNLKRQETHEYACRNALFKLLTIRYIPTKNYVQKI